MQDPLNQGQEGGLEAVPAESAGRPPAGDGGRPAWGPDGADASSGLLRLAELLRGRRVLVLSGAGLSTESGIPDYRGPTSASRPPRPVYYHEFLGSPQARARYWARSAFGWPRVARARPNAGHLALARLERAGAVRAVITQNVDRLHQAAGSLCVLELHGALAEALCLGCGAREERQGLQERILALNPGWAAEAGPPAAPAAPDGDARVEPPFSGSFRVPGCLRCGGILKPDVVFFGESVPRPRVEQAFRLLEEAERLLVVGSSLAVYSGFRFVARAAGEGKPVAIINLGSTRGDSLAAVRVAAPLGEALPRLSALLAAC